MSKVRRNDPCPCGSGKKYKKCHGAAIMENPADYNKELERLHSELISFSMREYGSNLAELQKEYTTPVLEEDNELSDVFTSGITAWTILNVPLLENNKTIFDAFKKQFNSTIKSTRIRTQAIFDTWADATPAVYEIISKNNEKNSTTFRHVLTKEDYEINFLEGNDFNIGDLAIGILIPYAMYHTFLYKVVVLYGDIKEDVINLIEEHTKEHGNLRENFPRYLAKVLSVDSEFDDDELHEWDNPLHEEVVEAFSKHMKEKGVKEEWITSGVQLWNNYCKQVNPALKKVNSYAAALAYYVYDSFAEGSATQSQIAKEYHTTASTVSTNFRKLKNVLG